LFRKVIERGRFTGSCSGHSFFSRQRIQKDTAARERFFGGISYIE
jgi:hypothetical protein